MSAAKIAITVAEVVTTVAISLVLDKYVAQPAVHKAFTPLKARMVKASV